jgi:polyisoprenoid-binding protein YceI
MEYLKTVNRAQLKQLFDDQADFALIDVLLKEYFEDLHVKGAVNACVYEVDFVSQVEKLVPDKSRKVILICNSATSKAPDVAVQKLDRAGYKNLLIYRGGTADWRRSGSPVEGKGVHAALPPEPESRVYTIDSGQSTVEWVGRNLTGGHRGTVQVSGSIPIRASIPRGAQFTLDMDSIRNLDLEDSALNRMLLEHLKSDDFFDVKKYPQAQFEATAFQPVEGAKPGANNYQVKGKLTIKDVTREIEFPAIISLRADGAIVADTHFDIDRTQWNVNYGSGKLFEKLGKHLVNDVISFSLKLVAK